MTHELNVLVYLRDIACAGNVGSNGWVGQQELQSRGGKRDLVTGAYGFNLLHFGYYLIGSWGIVPLGAGNSACCENAAIEAAANDDCGLTLFTKRQQFIEGFLFQKCVTACNQ